MTRAEVLTRAKVPAQAPSGTDLGDAQAIHSRTNGVQMRAWPLTSLILSTSICTRRFASTQSTG